MVSSISLRNRNVLRLYTAFSLYAFTAFDHTSLILGSPEESTIRKTALQYDTLKQRIRKGHCESLRLSNFSYLETKLIVTLLLG